MNIPIKTRKREYETKDLRKRTLVTDYGNIEYYRRYYRNKIYRGTI